MGLLFVCIGGVIGALGRYFFGILITTLFPKMKNHTSTLIINGIGSFILGIVLANFVVADGDSTARLLGITVGVVGSFTTYSTFSLDCVKLIQSKRWTEVVQYISTTLLISIGFYSIGFFLIN
jgi:CrcB protein